MTTLTWSAEGGTPPDTVTTANSGGASGDAFNATNSTNATLAYDATHPHGTGVALKVATGATAANPSVAWTTAMGTKTTVWFRKYLYFTANPSATHRIWQANSTSLAAVVEINTSGQIAYRRGSTLVQTFTNPIPLNAEFRIEGRVTGDAAAGVISVQLFTDVDGATPYEEHESTGLNTVGALSAYYFGAPGAAIANINPFWIDDLGLSDTGPLGPAVTERTGTGSAALTLSATALGANPGQVGAFINPAIYGGSTTLAQAIANFEEHTGRPLKVRRHFLGKNNMQTSAHADVVADINAGRICVLSYKPSYHGDGTIGPPLYSATAQATLDANVQSFVNWLTSAINSAGRSLAAVTIDLWQEPYYSGINNQAGQATYAQFVEMFRHYAPIIRDAGFKLGFCTSASSVHNSQEYNCYPGDAYVDICATDFYYPSYSVNVTRLADPGNIDQYDLAHDPSWQANHASPPKPFGIYETTTSTSTLPPPDNGQTQAQATTFWTYLKDAMAARAAGGLSNAAITIYDSTIVDVGGSPISVADGQTDPTSGQPEYRNALYAAIVDSVYGSQEFIGTGTATLTLAAGGTGQAQKTLAAFCSSYATISGETGWTSPASAYADDTSFATAAPARNTWYGNDFQGFDFSSIPAGSTINSVTVDFVTKESGTANVNYRSQAYDGATAIGTQWTPGILAGSTTEKARNYTTTPTLAQLQSATFGIRFEYTRTSTTANTGNLDFIRVTVDYTTPLSAAGTGSAALTLSATGQGEVGVESYTGTGSASISLSATGPGTKTTAAAASASLTLSATASASKQVTGPGSAAVTLADSATAAKRITAPGSASVTLSAAGSGSRGTESYTGTGSAALTLATSPAGTKRATGLASAALTLTATGPGSKRSAAACSAAVTLTAAPFGAKRSTGPGSASVTLASYGSGYNPAGPPEYTGIGSASLTLSATGPGHKSATGNRAAALALSASFTGHKSAADACSAALTLASGIASAVKHVVSAASAALALAASSVGCNPAAGPGLSARQVGGRLASPTLGGSVAAEVALGGRVIASETGGRPIPDSIGGHRSEPED